MIPRHVLAARVGREPVARAPRQRFSIRIMPWGLGEEDTRRGSPLVDGRDLAEGALSSGARLVTRDVPSKLVSQPAQEHRDPAPQHRKVRSRANRFLYR